MAGVPAQVRLSFATPSRRGDGALLWVFLERKSPYEPPLGAAGGIVRRRRVRGAASAPVGLHLRPGQKGTKHLVGQYGDRLVCVRYRYDPVRKKRIKTVELVVAESDWEPLRSR